MGISTGPIEARSRACYLADDQLEAIAVIREAIACRKAECAAAHEARDLAELSSYLNCRGLLGDADDALHEAARLIAGHEDSAEGAVVEEYHSWLVYFGGDPQAGLELARRSRETALRHGDTRTAANALLTIGAFELRRDMPTGRKLIEAAIEEARGAGFTEQVARGLNSLAAYAATAPHVELADTYVPQAIEYCVEHNEDLWRINALAIAARNALDRGRWTEAADFADRLLQDPRESPWPHHEALVVLGLVRARRGDPGATAALDLAAAVGVPADEVDVHVDLAAARAEVAWLEQRPDAVAVATGPVLDAALERGDRDAAARLSFWRTLAGLDAPAAKGHQDTEQLDHRALQGPPSTAVTPYALAAAGRWQEAAAAWTQASSPYEAALALIETNEERSLRDALELLQSLQALPASQLATRRLRALGARGLARGPRKATRENAAGLTTREIEVLVLLADGHRNTQIAERLFLSRRTVDSHVSALLRKLEAGSRVEAVASAQRLGLLQDR